MTSSTTAEIADTPPGYLPHKQVLTIMIGLLSGMFLAALDQMIVSTAIVKIANDLNGFNIQAWITTAYLITSTIVTPIYGKLSDIYGRKPLYLIAITIFLLGSIGSSFADSMYQLAAFRAVQGLGAGGLMSLAMTIIGDIVPARERSKYQGYFLATFGTATVLGPVLGGLFAGLNEFGGIAGWRWVFLVNVPIALIALAVVAKVLNVPHQRHNHRIDWWGGFALAVAVVPLLLVAQEGNTWGWASREAIICYAIGAVGTILFLFIEHLMKDEALIPLRLFRNGTFSVAVIGAFIVGIAMFGALTMVPQYMQVVQGYTPTQSGLLMLPVMSGIIGGSIISGQVTSRTGRYKILPVIGTLMIAIGALVFAQVSYNSALWHPLVAALIIGLGLGGCMQTLIIAAQNAGPRRDMGVSTATATFARQIGGTAGVAVFLTILFNVLPTNITKAFGGNPPSGTQLEGLQSNTSLIENLPEAIKTPVLIGFTESITTVFYAAGAVALLAFVVLLFMKEIPLADGASPASTLEGGEALLDTKDESAASESAATEESLGSEDASDAEKRELVTAGVVGSPTSNGHGEYQLSALSAPAINSVFDNSDSPVGQSITGHVRRQDGSPVAAIALTLIDQQGHQVARATGGSDGSYHLTPPGPGTYVLIVAAKGHQPHASSVMVGRSTPSKVDVTLAGSGELRGVVWIAGQDNAKLAGATITLTDSRGEVTDAVITAEDGVYAFHGVGAGSYTLVASAEHFRPLAVTLAVPENGVAQHDVELVGSVTLTGVARADGDLVPNARITVLDNQGLVAAVTRTDSAGNYLVSDLTQGDYTVVASGYPPATSQVNLLSTNEVKHDVQLGYDQVFDEFSTEPHSDSHTESHNGSSVHNGADVVLGSADHS